MLHCFLKAKGRRNGTLRESSNHKIHEQDAKNNLKRALQFSTSKNIKNLWCWEALGPAESCRDSSENVVFIIRLITEKGSKLIQKTSALTAPGAPNSQKVWNNEPTKKTWKNTFRKSRKKSKKTPKRAPGIYQQSIQNRRFGAVPASRVAKRGFWRSGMDFQVFGGTPEG